MFLFEVGNKISLLKYALQENNNNNNKNFKSFLLSNSCLIQCGT